MAKKRSLTERERAIMEMVIQGKSSKAMAAELHISIKTIEKHRKACIDKAEAENMNQAVAIYVREIFMAENTQTWYVNALEILGPFRFLMFEIVDRIESHNRFQRALGQPELQSKYIEEAKAAMDAANRFFSGVSGDTQRKGDSMGLATTGQNSTPTGHGGEAGG